MICAGQTQFLGIGALTVRWFNAVYNCYLAFLRAVSRNSHGCKDLLKNGSSNFLTVRVAILDSLPSMLYGLRSSRW